MKEMITDELIEVMAENYLEYKNTAIHIIGLDILTFEQYLEKKISEREEAMKKAVIQ